MTTFDIAPFLRTAIGFDRLSGLLGAAQDAATPSYPPYNIEKTGDDTYRLTLAVAGFAREDLEITAEANILAIAGKADRQREAGTFLHRGIAGRAFERRFTLADHVVVEAASLDLGLLAIDLRVVVPEALKPRRVEIGVTAD